MLTCILVCRVTVPAILDRTVGFRKDGAEPTLMNIVLGKPCKAEMYCRSAHTHTTTRLM